MNLFISHRGNINGKLSEENSPELIKHIIDLNYFVETDLWYIKNKLFLGHDEAQYPIEEDFFKTKKLFTMQKILKLLNTV